MWFHIFINGIVIGLMASFPLGPIGIMCIQRTLSRNLRSGFVSGLGATVADTIFAMAALFSLSLVMSFIDSYMIFMKGIGGLCVMVVGINIFLTNPAVQIRRNRAGKSSLWQDFLSVFLITFTNPAFILIFVALFAAFGVSYKDFGLLHGLLMILGVVIGSASWWFVLTFSVNLIRKKFRPRHLLWINRIAGAVIFILGAITIILMFVNTPINNVIKQ